MAQRALPGEPVSGDLPLVLEHEDGALIAVIDGVGHGREATRAAEVAVAVLRRDPAGSVHSLINRCHEQLARTRGVVMTLAKFNAADRTLTWGGVGNVEAVLFHAEPSRGSVPSFEGALLRGGVVGERLPPIYASVIPVAPGDLLVLASDGIRADFEQEVGIRSPVQRVADHLMAKYFKGTDDACVLAVKFLPGHE